MLIGDPAVFAIESGITEAYRELGLRALGYFVIHVTSRCYGCMAPDSSLLACSYDEVVRRVSRRGQHVAPFALTGDAYDIASAFRNAIYADDSTYSTYFGMPRDAFATLIYSNEIVWAPDGDEAFDDGSYVLQFDVDTRVRLIAFKSTIGYLPDKGSVSDIWMSNSQYYDILIKWRTAFELEWNRLLAMKSQQD